MFFTKKAPVQLETGEIFNPESWNENLTYAKAAISDVANKEIMRWTSHYSLCPNVSTALTPSTGIEYRKIGIPPEGDRIVGSGNEVDVYIESIAINAFYTATSPFTLNIYGQTENIVITFPERDASLATVPYNIVELANIVADRGGDLLLLDVLPTGTSITKLDITVGFASNKYECGDVSLVGFPSFTDSISKPDVDSLTFAREVTDGDVLNASTFSQLKTDLQNASQQAIEGSPVRWAHFQFLEYAGSFSNNSRVFGSLGSFKKAVFAKYETAPLIIGFYATGYVEMGASFSTATVNFNLCKNDGSLVSPLLDSSQTFTVSSTTGILPLTVSDVPSSPYTVLLNTGNLNVLTDDWYISSYISSSFSSNKVKRVDVYVLYQI